MRTPQEDLLVVEALVDYSWKLEDANPDRSYRAWVLAQEFARQHGPTIEDALRQREQISPPYFYGEFEKRIDNSALTLADDQIELNWCLS